MRTLLLLALVGCSRENPASTAAIALNEPLAIAAESAPISGGLAAHVVTAGGENQLTWPITRVALQLDSDGTHAWLRRLSLPLGAAAPQDPDAPKAPEGLMLRELSLSSDEPVRFEVVAASADELSLHAQSPLSLDWKLELTDGSLYPLGPLPTGPIDLAITVTRDQLRLTGLCRDGCAEIRSLMTVDAAAIAVSAPVTLAPR